MLALWRHSWIPPLRRAEDAERWARQLEAQTSDAMRQVDQAKLRHQETQQMADDLKRQVPIASPMWVYHVVKHNGVARFDISIEWSMSIYPYGGRLSFLNNLVISMCPGVGRWPHWTLVLRIWIASFKRPGDSVRGTSKGPTGQNAA